MSLIPAGELDPHRQNANGKQMSSVGIDVYMQYVMRKYYSYGSRVSRTTDTLCARERLSEKMVSFMFRLH